MHAVVAQIKAAPSFLADESPEKLCGDRPPGGLLGSVSQYERFLLNISSLHAPIDPLTAAKAAVAAGRQAANASAGTGVNVTAAQLYEGLLCAAFAKRLKLATHGRRKRMRSCAVVGSSGGLVGSRSGASIDAHNAVFRSNHASTASSHSRDVGRRTTFRVLNAASWERYRVARHSHGARANASRTVPVLWCFSSWLGICQVAALKGFFPTRNASDDLLGDDAPASLVNPVVMSLMMRMLVIFGDKMRRPPTGTAALGMALSMCGQVHVFGYFNFSDRHSELGNLCERYYGNCTQRQNSYFYQRAHHMQASWGVLSWLARRGYVTYHMPRPLAGNLNATFHPTNVSKASSALLAQNLDGPDDSPRDLGGGEEDRDLW